MTNKLTRTLADSDSKEHSNTILPLASAAFQWAREHVIPAQATCGWTRSTYADGVMLYYAATAAAGLADGDARDDLTKWGEQLNYSVCTDNGTWARPCAFSAAGSCADNQLCAATYVELYKAGLDLPVPHSLHTLAPIIDELKQEISAGSIADSTWSKIDLTYMAMAPLSRLGALTGDAAYFEKQWNNFNATMLAPQHPSTTYNLFNLTDRLFYQRSGLHGTDVYWARGNGWAMLGLLNAIRFGDAAAVKGGVADVHREEYIRVFKLFADRLLELQGTDGAWRSSLLHSSLFPQPETTGTASFTAGLAYGVNAGLLNTTRFAPAVWQAWDFLSTTALNSSGFVGHCQQAGADPTNTSFANGTSDFCVGMFLMAAAEVASLPSL